MLYKFYQLQLKEPTKGDWASTCQIDLPKLIIQESQSEIQEMTKNRFKNLLKQRIKTNALSYLINMQGSKGKEICYNEIQMQDYLLPFNNLTIPEKRNLFSIRNRMVFIPANYPMKSRDINCFCGLKENMNHIYSCKYSNKKEEILPFEKIYQGNIKQQVKVFKRFVENFEI